MCLTKCLCSWLGTELNWVWRVNLNYLMGRRCSLCYVYLLLGKCTEGSTYREQTFSSFLCVSDWRSPASDWADAEGYWLVSGRPSFHLLALSISFSVLVDSLGCKKGKVPVMIELMLVICLFLSCMENIGSSVLSILSAKLCNWRSIFFHYDECHRKRSCLHFFLSFELWFNLVKV